MVASNQKQAKVVSAPSDYFRQGVAGCLKAVADMPQLEVEFAGDTARRSGSYVVLPEPGPAPDRYGRTVLRGEADTVALWLSEHNPDIHKRFRPSEPVAEALFTALEQTRVDAVGVNRYRGMAVNLSGVLEERLIPLQGRFNAARNREDVPLELALTLLLRERMTGLTPPPGARRAVDLWRDAIEAKAGVILDHMALRRNDQADYARWAHRLMQKFSFVGDEDVDLMQAQEELVPIDAPPDQKDLDEEAAGTGAPEKREERDGESDSAGDPVGDVEIDEDASPADKSAEKKGGVNPNPEAEVRAEAPYKVFTTAYDEIITPEDIVSLEDLARLRGQLDEQLKNFQSLVARLANRLQRRLLAWQNRSWEFDLEEGMLDPARLTRVITDPFSALSFKRELDTHFRDTVVTLLMDNSGSMRGRQILVAAACADILARTLERCGVTVEILGFTTREWKGGQSKQAWLRAGKPPEPGRLNDLRHIIYKSADVPWRRAKNNMGLMLRDNILKENIDGEALAWAHGRLIARPEQRRILMVISDGTPIDDTTASVNSVNYLERHLHTVVAEIERGRAVELTAIGIGYDVSRFYRRAVTIHDVDELGGVMMEKLAELFDETGAA
ncbi:MAG: cobaltochelatase subunit CobT [Methylobacteriaceae bacterium]|jgi:cobaltochelatase CobT|nr:cobaltochelatase subunit CobT [Methylobacteriaceae bacterium]